MAQKWTLNSSGTTGDRASEPYLRNAQVQLSDGTFVFVYRDFNGGLKLVYTSDHTTTNVIATLTSFSTLVACSLVRDSSDNLFVVGGNGATLSCQAFTKGVGYTWTAQSVIGVTTTAAPSPTTQGVAWCNTGGGTNNKGHLMVVGDYASGSAYQILDAGAALNGAGTLSTASGTNPTFLGASNFLRVDLSQDGLGAANGVSCVFQSTFSNWIIGSWSVTSGGALGTNTTVTTTLAGSFGSGGVKQFQLVRVSSNLWAFLFLSATTSGRIMCARMSATALLSAGIEHGALTNFVPNGDATGAVAPWSAFLDPGVAGQIWIYGLDQTYTTAGTNTVRRLSLQVTSSTTTWGSTGVSDDNSVGIGTLANDKILAFRCVRQPTGSKVDYIVWDSEPGTADALLGDFTQFNNFPNAPSLTAPAPGTTQDLAAGFTFTWTFSDPDPGDTQSAFAFRRKISGGSYEWWTGSAWQGTEIYVASATASLTFAASKWVNGNTYVWSVSTKDAAGYIGPYAADTTVLASTAAVVTVTAPTGTVTTTTRPTVTWSVADAESDAQQTYQIKVESGAYSTTPGSGTSVWDTGEIVDAGTRSRDLGVDLANGTTFRAFVRVKTNGQYSAWAFNTFTENVTPPATPTLTAVAGTHPSTGQPRVLLTATGTAGPPAAQRMVFEFSDDAGTTWTTVRNGSGVAVNGSYVATLFDYELVLAMSRSYRARALADV